MTRSTYFVRATIQTELFSLAKHFNHFQSCVCVCVDINECLRSVCPFHQQCKNTDGGYQCFDSCPPGMTQTEPGMCVGECVQNVENKIDSLKFITLNPFARKTNNAMKRYLPSS